MKENVFRWLVFYITSYEYEYDYFVNKIMPFLKSLNETTVINVEADIIFVGRTKKNKELIELALFHINNKKPFYEKEEIKKDMSLEEMLIYLINKEKPNYNGILLSSHANGVTIGSDSYPVIEVVEFAKLCEKYVVKDKIDYFIFDSCYMGSLEPLYEVAHLCKYVLATPSYHDGKRSMMECPAMYIKHDDPLLWLSKFGIWYITQANRYAKRLDHIIQWVIYSSDDIIKLADYLVESGLYEHLVFKKSSIIYWDDENLYNISKVLNDTELKYKKLKKKIDYARYLLLKSYYYYDKADSQNFESSVLSIHNGLPSYIMNKFNCKLQIFSKTYCVKERKKNIKI